MRSRAMLYLPRLDRAVLAVILMTAAVLLDVRPATSAEVIPGIGVTRTVDGGDEAQLSGSLALRGNLLPILKSEIAVGYRHESLFDDALKVRMWPITTSLWLAPVPALYFGAGVGWYHVTLDYDEDRVVLPLEDNTEQEFGIHLGGGVQVPLGTRVGVDLGGRYVMMRDQEGPLVPEQFDGDFWTTTVGLAIKF